MHPSEGPQRKAPTCPKNALQRPVTLWEITGANEFHLDNLPSLARRTQNRCYRYRTPYLEGAEPVTHSAQKGYLQQHQEGGEVEREKLVKKSHEEATLARTPRRTKPYCRRSRLTTQTNSESRTRSAGTTEICRVAQRLRRRRNQENRANGLENRAYHPGAIINDIKVSKDR